MMREKFMALHDCQELLKDTPDCDGIYIGNDGVIYEDNNGAKLYVDFDE